ncbi:transporter substrate-binding domain-containing protein [Pyramidobacter sp. SM-530-WT-4B]|uniref:Transporter substrate-binding domain-containing protein n=1 Tax=Pyramidobacter porci TaxID=2605789 RepID=A0A6L5YD06_9BACT|nr:transporter substrate-binding domain-containing protein [Pyramidobacter porci]MDY2649356.1 transporter substrate-binding domain-containing protein [Pyramidobacter porci]MST56226.1 transporter substrate-binding domain-containing protein [Pyramidobacter porci]
MNLKRICALSLAAAALTAGAACAAGALKEITVASGNSSVPNSYVSKGQHLGTEPDIWAAIAARTGLKVNFVTGEFNTLFGYLDSGRADTVGNTITVNQKRIDKYRFSEPYAYIPEKLVVHEERTDLKRLKDIDGLKCGYSAGSNGGNLFKQIAEKEGIKVELAVFDSSDLLNEAFRQGKVDVMIFAGSEAAFKIKNGFLKARTVEENIAVGEKAFPFRTDEKSLALRAVVTKAIQEMKADGTLTAIYQKWFNDDFSQPPAGYVSPWKLD